MYLILPAVTKVIYVITSYIMFTLIFLLWLPLYIYKQLLSITVEFFIQDIERILPTTETILSDEDICNTNNNCTIVTVMTIKGIPTTSEIKEIFDKNVLQAKLKPSSLSRYPELKQYSVSLMGYSFLKKDPNFSLSNHILERDCGNFYNRPLNKLCQEMLNFTYPPKRSPWQLVIMRYNDQNSTHLVFRCHHSLCDGRSVLKLLVECLGEKQLQSSEAVFKPWSILDEIKYFVMCPIEFANLAVSLLKSEKRIANHPLNSQNTPNNTDNPFFVGITQRFALRDITSVAIQYKVRTSAVLLSAIASSVQKMLTLRKNNVATDNNNDRNLQIYLILPKQAHPPTLVNHVCIGLPDIKYYSSENRIEHLQSCDRIYQEMREGDHSRYVMSMTKAIASLPKPLRKHMGRMRAVSTGFSNISGDRDGFFVGTRECTDFSMCSSPPQGSIGASFLVMSYKGYLRVALVAKGGILSELETNSLTQILEDELLALIKSL